MITNEQQQLAPNKLMGFCENDQEWYKYDSETDPNTCPKCGGRPSARVGFQITTQRSFDPAAKKMTKAQAKKMGMGA